MRPRSRPTDARNVHNTALLSVAPPGSTRQRRNAGEEPKKRAKGNTGKSALLKRGLLTETTPIIMHSRMCFEAFCDTVLKIRTLALISTREELAVVQGGP